MKKFLIHIALFFIPLVVMAYVADYAISQQLRKSKLGEYGVWNDILSDSLTANTLIYGSSRAWVQINPRKIDGILGTESYNFGIDGHNFKMQKLRHDIYLESHPKPTTIIHSVDVFTLGQKKELFNLEQFLPYVGSNDELDSVTSEYKGFDFFDYHLPLVRYYGKIETLKHALNIFINPEANITDRNRGYKGQDRNWNADFDIAQASSEKIKMEIDSAAVSQYESFLITCIEDDIDVIMVYTPEYIKGQEFVSNRTEIMDIFRGLAVKYNIPFLDYSNNHLCYDTKYFYNAGHLNLNGSTIFSEELAIDLKKHINR